MSAEHEQIERLSKDLKKAAETLSPTEAKFMVKLYYQIQRERIYSQNIERATSDSGEPNLLVGWMGRNQKTIENDIKRAMDAYSSTTEVGRWSRTQVGIGPVLAAGLMAHIDIHKAPSVGHIWNYAGLNPLQKWGKGELRPWNGHLKTLCWKIGESFVKVSGREDAFYGRMYAERKVREIAKNEAGDFADQARAKLENFKIGKKTNAYKAYSKGKLPDAHIYERSKRWAVKLFLSHWHWVAYETEFGTPPPKPYPVEHLGHVHVIPPPLWQ